MVGPWRKMLSDTRFVAPDAPFPATHGGHQWFRVDGQELHPDHVAFVRQEFDDLIERMIAREGFGGLPDRVAFVGVSQGAIMALDGVASGRWPVRAVVSFAGLLPIAPLKTETKTSILLIHGEQDFRIPSLSSKAAAGRLKSAGFDVTLKLLPGEGHGISAPGGEEALRFLCRVFKD